MNKNIIYKLGRLFVPDALFTRLKFRKNMGYWPDLKNPRTFNEKLNWLKLHDHNPLYTTMVDKYEAKKYVAGIIGEEYLIPTYGVWDTADDIDFATLPDKFVMKTTHDSGTVVICRDKSLLNIDAVRKKMRKALKRDFYAETREWPYKNVKPRIIAEKLLEADDSGSLSDYKVHNFKGVPETILLSRDRFGDTGLTEDFFTTDWKHIEVARPYISNAGSKEEMPAELETMLNLSKQLAERYPFMRTDFYTSKGKVYFGEITFYPASGAKPFDPSDFDNLFGDWLEIPTDKIGVDKTLINSNIILSIKYQSLKDYKFFCFNGKVEYFKIDFDRHHNHRANYYNRRGNLLPWGEDVCPPDLNRKLHLPSNLDKMIGLAERLSTANQFLRVDFYETHNRIYIGELTFFPNSGYGKFTDSEIDDVLGTTLDIKNSLK